MTLNKDVFWNTNLDDIPKTKEHNGPITSPDLLDRIINIDKIVRPSTFFDRIVVYLKS